MQLNIFPLDTYDNLIPASPPYSPELYTIQFLIKKKALESLIFIQASAPLPSIIRFSIVYGSSHVPDP